MRIPEIAPDEEPALNLTSMIDVVFLLLIFFMVSTTFLDPERQVDLELPRAPEAGAEAERQAEIVVNVLADGRVSIGGAMVDDEGLRTALRQAAAADPEIQVTIRGDRKTHHEHIVRVMNACGAAGLANLAVSVLEEQ
ncbi:MAG: biopolymer transporter ExbD [Planctomycetota bacterium]|nr:MAG: biopolymer transporter ExbD [Planctomycetota bacterium]